MGGMVRELTEKSKTFPIGKRTGRISVDLIGFARERMARGLQYVGCSARWPDEAQ